MPRGLNNWSYRDVIGFLKENGFEFYKQLDGSHETWIKQDASGEYVVEVNVIHGGDSYINRTLETMIRQSCIDKKVWREWASK